MFPKRKVEYAFYFFLLSYENGWTETPNFVRTRSVSGFEAETEWKTFEYPEKRVGGETQRGFLVGGADNMLV